MDIENLYKVIDEEKRLYLNSREKTMKFAMHPRYAIWTYLQYFRLCRYWHDVRESEDVSALAKRRAKYIYRVYERRKNIWGQRAGVEIGLDSEVGAGVNIWHGGVIINGRLGDNCVLHGNNTIGNKRSGAKDDTPVIGNNVDIGAGAVIIGGIHIADNCVIGAGAVVTRSCETPGSVLAGVPARVIGNISDKNKEA
ncbi:MAG: 2,3,4,5-tetrahydropyridine-2,6-carboxylate N-succinyltransferase [Clostridia bacterium]|nr:2,3,4,5-tetrahydropyridine-2,6-carboxylate N-succinyltransferase [Clostridia bacterium]